MNRRLKEQEQLDLETCKQTLTITWKKPIPPRIDEAFYSWCRRTNNPYVRIRQKRNSADIFMDLPNASGVLDSEGKIEFSSLCLSYGFPEKGNTFRVPSADDIPLAVVPEFARKAVSIGLGFCGRLGLLKANVTRTRGAQITRNF